MTAAYRLSDSSIKNKPIYNSMLAGNFRNNSSKANGGDKIVSDGTYWYHVFTSSGTFVPKQAITVNFLVIAGGGAGGGAWGAGGGAGGLVHTATQSLTSGTIYTAVVGAGGAKGSQTRNSGVASNVIGGTLTLTEAVGGGHGGIRTSPYTGGNGGSGGGGAGGGGFGGTGGSTTSATNGAGGVGTTTYSSWGSATGTGQNSSGTYYYCGGGGGGASVYAGGTTAGTGGLGGGGAGGGGGGNYPSEGVDGTPNSGGGGGGGAQGNIVDTFGGNGGSGVIIIRYAV